MIKKRIFRCFINEFTYCNIESSLISFFAQMNSKLIPYYMCTNILIHKWVFIFVVIVLGLDVADKICSIERRWFVRMSNIITSTKKHIYQSQSCG